MTRNRFRHYIAFVRNALLIFIILLVIFIYQGTKIYKEKLVAKIPRSAMKYVQIKDNWKYNPINTHKLRRLINEYNTKEKILNVDAFGPIKRDTVILVILVHKHTETLKFLLLSLSQAKGIQEALLIFSHSSFNEHINNMIHNIDFCRVVQIFYPYSLQANPDRFPGFQSDDCSYNMNLETAAVLNCTGASTPDIHGRFRHPENSEKKHHWWWTANKVFENLTCTEDHEGFVMFLEDDVYFLEDFIYMALYMKNAAESLEQCDFLSLGSNAFSSNPSDNDTYRVEVMTWDPLYHSTVLVFDLSVWNTIVTNYDLFCRVDDYSWSRSLLYLSLNRRGGTRYKVMSCVVPRAFKTNSRFYEKYIHFDLLDSVYKVLDLQRRYGINLYPPHLEVFTHIEMEDDDFIIFDYVEGNGGWSDPRDIELCKNMTISKIKKVIFDMKNEFEDLKSYEIV